MSGPCEGAGSAIPRALGNFRNFVFIFVIALAQCASLSGLQFSARSITCTSTEGRAPAQGHWKLCVALTRLCETGAGATQRNFTMVSHVCVAAAVEFRMLDRAYVGHWTA